MTYGKIIRTSRGFDISWSNDHFIKADLRVLGEIDNQSLLYYSYADQQLAVYDTSKLTSQFVKLVLHPLPTHMSAGDKPNFIKAMALHPRFHLKGNNFVVLLDQNNSVNVCVAKFVPTQQGETIAQFSLPRPELGKFKIEVIATPDNGLVTFHIKKDNQQTPLLLK